MLKPPVNKGMTVLDRSKFNTVLPLLMVRLNPAFLSKISRQAAPGDLLDIRGVSRVIQTEEDKKTKALLLGLHIELPEQLSNPIRELLAKADAIYKPYTLILGYEHWSADEIFASIFGPENDDIPSGFTVVGHIAHMNLRAKYLPFKHLIGEVILDKNPPVRMVVNKLDSIHHTYRTFDMEVIAGETDDFWVEQHESGCRFQFDFRKVYWNSRLHTEHERLVSGFAPGEAVCDPFAGVGPFAIPAAKKHCVVVASDLNPACAAAMERNVKLNHVSHFCKVYNLDGRECIRQSLKILRDWRSAEPEIKLPLKKKRALNKDPMSPQLVPDYFSHYVMNLPHAAIEFLDAFRGLYVGFPEAQNWPLPSVHVHCFYKHEPDEPAPPMVEVKASLTRRVSRAIGHSMAISDIHFHDVRRVSPTKEMYCLSFTLPRAVAFAVDS